ncbi:protein GET1 [Papiliotrema laurentii]|uniref:Protein GET1 n=1 Tax=Papiliotrema laurentii TaxID=5418 RepID=A0AAD9FWC6_PAPLA|nr:protein GET1 [Papiliotrema laurentii]
MPSLAILIFIVVLLTQTVSWVGKTVLQELAFAAYSRVFLSGTASKQRALRKQVLTDKAELAKTSSQDEFAKWAKLRRKLDKGIADLEKINNSLTSARTGFGLKFSTLIWTTTTGAQLVLVWWYRRQPVFWLPKGWLPGPAAWLLSLPSAPKGAVSSAAWCAVCKRVLATLEEVVKDLLTPVSAPAGAVPVSVPSQAPQQQAKIEPLELEHEKLD